MWPVAVVIMSPFFGDVLRFPEGREQAFIQTFIPHAAIEGFAEAVLRRLAWLNELQIDAASLRPVKHCQGSELGAVVADNELRSAMQIDQPSQLASHALAADRGIYRDRMTLLGEVIDHIE